MATRTSNVWRYIIPRICRSIGSHFKLYVDRLIVDTLSNIDNKKFRKERAEIGVW